MKFLLLLLLVFLSSSLLTSARNCEQHAACLYFTTCYDAPNRAPNSTRTQHTVYAGTTNDFAIAKKKACSGYGYVSRLSILSTSAFSMNISFETDLKEVGFLLGSSTNESFLKFVPGSVMEGNANGINLVLEELEGRTDSLGRSTYFLRVEDRRKVSLHSLFGRPLYFLLENEQIAVNATDFWPEIRKKLACKTQLIYDICYASAGCHEALISAHSVKCEPGWQLQFKSADSWTNVSLAQCIDATWIFKTEKGKQHLVDKKTNVACQRGPELPSATTPSSPIDSEPEEPVRPVQPIEQVKEPAGAPPTKEETATTAKPAAGKKEHKGFLPGNKWIWIGGGVVLLLIIIIIIGIAVYFKCCRKGDGTTSRPSRTTRRSKKKKGGKRESTSSSSKKPLKSAKSKRPSRSEMTAKSGLPNTMSNLDNIKTEMIS